ncbi:MAG: RHS repeat-associated core domain-containing protein [Phycisphaerae bacterium]|jgi:RHS repeat-associated protein
MYIYANSEILSEHDGGALSTQYYYLHDRLGSVRQVLNSSGSVVKLLTYSPFGETILEEGSYSTPWQFTGQYLDSETGMYYLRARQYSPYLARFTGRDLLMGDVNEPLTLHRYLYCQNDPIDWIDPSGFDKYLGLEKDKHMWVGVDVWEDGKVVGQIKYSFKANPRLQKILHP